MSAADPDFGEVSRRLTDKIEMLAVELLGQPSSRTKQEWRFGASGAISVAIAGAKRGQYNDFSADVGGDPIELIANLKGLDKKGALDWGCSWLGIERVARSNGNGAARGPAVDSDAERIAKRDAILAHSIAAKDTPAARYLDRRGIGPAALALPCIGWNPRAWHGQEGHFGAIVFKATTEAGDTVAVQQVYLTADGQKAPLDPAKRTNGALAGAAVRFPGDADSGRVILAEGPETGLALWEAMREDTWACLGVGNIGAAPIPAGIEVIVARDADETGSKADQTVLKAADRLVERGYRVRIAAPPRYDGLRKTDFNDVLLRDGRDEIRRAIDAAIPVEPKDIVDAGAKADQAIWIDDESWSEDQIPPRPWVAPGYALRGAVTVIAGPPSAMKSSLMLAWGAAVGLGRPHGDFCPTEEAAVALVYNTEDDRTEQRRRLSAVLRQFDATPRDIAGKLLRTGPAGVGTLFAIDKATGRLDSTPAMDRLRDLVRERQPALLICDPLCELHTAEENDNSALRTVIAEFRAIATEFNVAVILVHHTRKGAAAPGDPDSARGASAIIGAARIVATLVGMSDDDADALGLPNDRKARSRYVRLDGAKSNYAGIGNPEWYEKVLYNLDNGETVPAAVPWTAPDIWQSVPTAVAIRILDEIDAGIDGGKQRYTDAPAATDRAAWRVVSAAVPSLGEKQARKIVQTWVKNQVLRREEYEDSADRKRRIGLAVNAANRPGTTR